MVSANPALRAGLLGTQRSVCVRGVAEPKAPALCVGSFGLFLSKKGPGGVLPRWRGTRAQPASCVPATSPRLARAGAMLQQAGAPAL